MAAYLTERWSRWAPMSGILMCVAWSPMLVVIPRLPDLGSRGDVEAFWDENVRLMKFVVLAAAVGYLFLLGFLFTFVLGGLSGVMVAVVPFDLQVHDTYFVVAHLHYVLIGGMVFPLFATFYYWLPMVSRNRLSETLGRWVFGLMFVGFNVAFFPMHAIGLLGMPRRIYTYDAALGLESLNLLSTIGAFLLGIAILVFLLNVWWSRRRGGTPGAGPAFAEARGRGSPGAGAASFGARSGVQAPRARGPRRSGLARPGGGGQRADRAGLRSWRGWLRAARRQSATRAPVDRRAPRRA